MYIYSRHGIWYRLREDWVADSNIAANELKLVKTNTNLLATVHRTPDIYPHRGQNWLPCMLSSIVTCTWKSDDLKKKNKSLATNRSWQACQWSENNMHVNPYIETGEPESFNYCALKAFGSLNITFYGNKTSCVTSHQSSLMYDREVNWCTTRCHEATEPHRLMYAIR